MKRSTLEVCLSLLPFPGSNEKRMSFAPMNIFDHQRVFSRVSIWTGSLPLNSPHGRRYNNCLYFHQTRVCAHLCAFVHLIFKKLVPPRHLGSAPGRSISPKTTALHL